MQYVTNKQKIMEYIEINILAFLKQKDLDYNKVIDLISEKTSSNPSMVKTILDSFINSGKIKQINILTIPDKQIDGWLKEVKEMEEQKKKDDAEVKKILESKPKEDKNASKE